MFQSAPRSEERGDRDTCVRMRDCVCFNPRPAPRSGAMDRLAELERLRLFQSAPRSEERGDTGSRL